GRPRPRLRAARRPRGARLDGGRRRGRRSAPARPARGPRRPARRAALLPRAAGRLPRHRRQAGAGPVHAAVAVGEAASRDAGAPGLRAPRRGARAPPHRRRLARGHPRAAPRDRGGGAVTLFLVAIGLSLAGTLLGRPAALAASAVGLAAATAALLGGDVMTASAPWPVPLGRLAVGVDLLSAFFLLCIYLVAGLAALAGPTRGAFNLLVAALAAVVLARDGVLFVVAWEVMSVAGFFLLGHDTRAGLTYLIAAHLGVVCLVILFAL